MNRLLGRWGRCRTGYEDMVGGGGGGEEQVIGRWGRCRTGY